MTLLSGGGGGVDTDLKQYSPFFKDLVELDIGESESNYYDSNEFLRQFRHDKNIFLLSLNCCSLMSKLSELKVFLSEINQKLPHIICFQEIFHIPECFDLNIPGFTFLSRQRKNLKVVASAFLSVMKYNLKC